MIQPKINGTFVIKYIGLNKIKHILQLNLATLLISTSGPIGRHLSVSPEIAIFSRSLIGGLILFSIIMLYKQNIGIEKKDRKKMAMTSFLLAVHWLLYFYALKTSSVAIAMISIYTYPIFIVILEPFFSGLKLKRRHLYLSFMVVVGISVMALGRHDIKGSPFLGILFGVSSAIAYALRNILSKSMIGRVDGKLMMAWQVIGVSIFTLPLCFGHGFDRVEVDWPWLVFLGLLTTAIGHSFMLHCFQFFTSSEAGILSSMQPIFGITMGILFLNEFPSIAILLGGTIIIFSVLIEAISYKNSV